MSRREKKGLPGCVWVLIFVVLIIAVAVGGVYALYRSKLGKIKHFDKADTKVEKNVKEFFEETKDLKSYDLPVKDPKDIEWPADEELMQKEGVSNVLVLAKNPDELKGRPSVKAMMLLTVNKNTKAMTMTHILNDTYGQIPGFSDNRIRTSYEYGGIGLIGKAVEKNFAVKLNGTIVIEYEDLMKMAEKLGADDVTEIKSDDQAFQAIESVFKKLAGTNPLQMLSLADELLPLMTTDMSSGDISSYVIDLVKMGLPSPQKISIPQEGTYEKVIIRKMVVLVPDLTANRNYLKEQLFQ